MFANIKHSITVFNEHLFDVCEDSSKCEKVCVWLGYKLRDFILRLMYYHNISYAVNLLSSEYIHSISPKKCFEKDVDIFENGNPEMYISI